MKIKENKFTWAMILFTFVLFWNNFAGTTSNINTTMLAFHYGYGFISLNENTQFFEQAVSKIYRKSADFAYYHNQSVCIRYAYRYSVSGNILE